MSIAQAREIACDATTDRHCCDRKYKLKYVQIQIQKGTNVNTITRIYILPQAEI